MFVGDVVDPYLRRGGVVAPYGPAAFLILLLAAACEAYGVLLLAFLLLLYYIYLHFTTPI